MKAPLFALAGLLAVLPAATPAPQPAPGAPPQAIEKSFKPGGRVGLDLSAGRYLIRGGSDDAIRVRWSTPAADVARVRNEVAVEGASATIRTRGPKDRFSVEIDLPHRTDIDLSLSAGDLTVRALEGNKTVSVWAGDVTLEVGASEQYRQVDASVRMGDMNLAAFGKNSGGLFRSFSWTGSGKYILSAKLFAGDLKLIR